MLTVQTAFICPKPLFGAHANDAIVLVLSGCRSYGLKDGWMVIQID